MQILEEFELTPYNTLRLASIAKFYVALNHINQLPEIFKFIQTKKIPYMILGGGSNLLLPSIYNGLIIHNQLLGIEKITPNSSKASNSKDQVLIRVMAGVNWDEFVSTTVKDGYYGLENLSLIPGTVGASPIQNIGAYGVEAKDFIQSVEVYDLEKNVFKIFDNSECQFSYRHSLFKTKPNYLVSSVVFNLLLTPKLNTSYGDIAKQMAAITNATAMDLRSCIIKTRQSKLPDPKIIGNVGSFFHNPILPKSQIELLHQSYPDLPSYPAANNMLKVSAGWLIDNLGLKGFRSGNVGVYEKQALVLVNHKQGGSQQEVLALAKLIQDKVFATYKILLNIEPIVVN